MADETPDAALVAEALRRAETRQDSGSPFRRAALRTLPVATAAQLLRQEAAEALAAPPGMWRSDRLVDHLFATEGRDCVLGSVTLPDGVSLSMDASRARILILPAETLEP